MERYLGGVIAQTVYQHATVWTARVRFPAEARDCVLPQSVQTGSSDYPASYPMGTGALSLE
jgi:hypothetical protein